MDGWMMQDCSSSTCHISTEKTCLEKASCTFRERTEAAENELLWSLAHLQTSVL